MRDLGNQAKQQTGRYFNNRIESSHLPFRRTRNLQKFAAMHASIRNHFSPDRHLSSRSLFKANRAAALQEWRALIAA